MHQFDLCERFHGSTNAGSGEGVKIAGPAWYAAWCERWEAHLLRLRRSPATLETWGVYVRKFGDFLDAEGVQEPELLTRDVLHRFQDAIRVALPKESSQQVTVTAVRNLLKWADGEDLLPRPGIWMYLERPRVDQVLPRPLAEDTLAAIVTHYSRPTPSLERLRDRALFWFLVTTGSRISAALAIRTGDVHGQRVIVRQKGGREHVLVMSRSARSWVDAYLAARGRDQVPYLWIYIGERGRRQLHDYQANRIWDRLADQLRIPHFTSHQLKHTSASELGDLEKDNQLVSHHIGWKDPSMMERYRAIRGELEQRQEMVDRLDGLITRHAPAPVIRPAFRRRRPGPRAGREWPA